MPNYNRLFDAQEFDPLIRKYQELCEVRKEVELLTGETSHERIMEALRDRRKAENLFSCPPHLYLGMTPSKQEVVKNSWDSEIQLLRKKGVRDESILSLISQMREKETMSEVRSYLQDRKNYTLESKEEKTFKRFNR